MKKKRLWMICKIAVGIMVIITFSPLVIPAEVFEPKLLGMPYTLWAGFIDAAIILGITWFATRVHPGIND